jgi:hypothetical protein
MKKKILKKSIVPTRYTVLNSELDTLPIKEVYPKLVEKLQIDLKRCGEGKLRELISQTPEDLRLAGYIYAVATEDHEKIKDAFEAKMGQWVIDAKREIAAKKKAKEWEGGTYTADVERVIAAEADGYKQAKEKLNKSARIKDAARRLFESYEIRLSSLQTYAKLVQKRMGLSVEQKHG